MPALTKLDIALSVPTPYDVSKCLSGMKCESIATFRLHWQRLEPGFQSMSMGVGIFGVVTHSGLFRGHPSPGTKIRNDTFGTYFLVQQLTTTQWHIIWLYLSTVKLIPCTENLFVAHGNIKTTGLLRSGFSLGDLRYESSLWRKVRGHWGPWGCQRARVKIMSRNCIDFV